MIEVLPKRMSKYDLTVHPEKTRLVRFEPPQTGDSDTKEREPPGPTTFDFLGFTHYWGRSQRGAWVAQSVFTDRTGGFKATANSRWV
jgi:hypothetical protein